MAADTKNFPHYSTLGQTELSYTEVNLLANLTTWNILEGNPDEFLNMYT